MKNRIKQVVALFIIWLISLSVYDVLHSTFSVESSRNPSKILADIAETKLKLVALQTQAAGADAVIMVKRAELLCEYGKLFWSDDGRIHELEQEIKHYETLPNQIAELEDKLRTLTKELGPELTSPSHWYSPLLAFFGILYGRLWDAFGYTFDCIILYIPFKVFCYYVLAPIVSRCAHVTFGKNSPSENADNISILQQQRGIGTKSLSLQIQPSESITVIGEKYIQGRKENLDSKIRKSTCWLLDWSHPIMCIVCKLCFMTKFENRIENETPLVLSITSNNADEYYACINIEQGQEYYIRPSDLVAFGGGVQISASWKLFSLTAWCMGQVRFFVLSGDGRVVVRSLGGFTEGTVSSNSHDTQRKHSLVCASQGVKLHVTRNETFWPVLVGEAKMFDLRLDGSGTYLISNVVEDRKSDSEKVMQTILKALGQFLGF